MIKLIETKEGTVAVLKNDTHLSRWVEEHNSLHVDGALNFVLPLIQPGDYVVDVGANIGDHTVAYANAVGAGGKVFAFEPMPETFACLAVNTRDLPQVEAYNLALSRWVRIVQMKSEENAGAAYIKNKYPGWNLRVTPNTITLPLDAFALPQLNFMKIDVEGHELEVLYGAAETIRKCLPRLLVEINHEALIRSGATSKELLSLLHNWGYVMSFLEPHHNLDMPMVNALFTASRPPQ